MRYSPELLDRVADAMNRAQTYHARISTGPDGKFCYQVGYMREVSSIDPDDFVPLLECETRAESLDAQEVMERRAQAAAALMAVDYVP